MIQCSTVAPAEFSRSAGVTVKNGQDAHPCDAANQLSRRNSWSGTANPPTLLTAFVVTASHSAYGQTCAVAAAQQDSAALSRIGGFAGIPQLNAGLGR